MKQFISLFIIILFFWLLFTGSFVLQEILVGFAVAFLVSIFSRKIFQFNILTIDLPVRIFKYLFFYIPRLIYEMIKANIQLALIVLNPRLPLNSGIIKNKTNLKGDISKLLLANSITLTPGTLTVDVEKDLYYIHTVNISKIKDDRSITKIFEKSIKGVFDE